MKKLLIASAIALASFSVQAKDITFATEPHYPPFELTNEKGELIGFDIDIAYAICKEIQAHCTFKTQSFDSLIQSLKQKRIDAAISAMDITEARSKQVLFSDSYYDNSARFVGMKDKFDLTTAKNIGVQNGTTFQQYIVAEGKQYNPKSYNSLQDAILDLKNGRIDLIFGDMAVLADMMQKEENLAFVGEKVVNEQYFGTGAGIAVNKDNTELVAELNKGLAIIKANGEYQKIHDKWMTNK